MTELHGLYAITDAGLIEQDVFIQRVEQAILGGVRLIQYRDKSQAPSTRLAQASALKKLCQQHQARLIINDDIQLALDVDADGVHIGKDDAALESARQQLGTDKIIGVSCYNQLQLALDAEQQGADYIAFGSFFPSPTKPGAPQASLQLLREARQQLQCPICCIGGITQHNASTLLEAGADMLAVISDIFGQHDSQTASRNFMPLFNRSLD